MRSIYLFTLRLGLFLGVIIMLVIMAQKSETQQMDGYWVKVIDSSPPPPTPPPVVYPTRIRTVKGFYFQENQVSLYPYFHVDPSNPAGNIFSTQTEWLLETDQLRIQNPITKKWVDRHIVYLDQDSMVIENEIDGEKEIYRRQLERTPTKGFDQMVLLVEDDYSGNQQLYSLTRNDTRLLFAGKGAETGCFATDQEYRKYGYQIMPLPIIDDLFRLGEQLGLGLDSSFHYQDLNEHDLNQSKHLKLWLFNDGEMLAHLENPIKAFKPETLWLLARIQHLERLAGARLWHLNTYSIDFYNQKLQYIIEHFEGEEAAMVESFMIKDDSDFELRNSRY